ncbi:hypothetical protein KJI95_08305 [Shewanella sp. JM162201]|uniref:Uncharacterized protein n=1 Tax=Shewanella jiangmenensis TaxID=2837387 RepID=A0ABS5V3M5_9GAMM|nr:hypothetical protein [Shewanella jiangmenensis]MBT1444530.1 hypothetical protein [Shewanella jiangmenensis]
MIVNLRSFFHSLVKAVVQRCCGATFAPVVARCGVFNNAQIHFSLKLTHYGIARYWLTFTLSEDDVSELIIFVWYFHSGEPMIAGYEILLPICKK